MCRWTSGLKVLLGPLAGWALAAFCCTQVRAADCIAHRGDSIRHPGNTQAAIDSAWKAGTDVVEIDVRMSADGVLLLFHDEGFKDRPVAGMTVDQLRAAVADYQVPTLQEVLKAAQAGQRYLLDLKVDTEPFLTQLLALVEGSTPAGCEIMLQSTSMPALAFLRQRATHPFALFLVSDLKGEPAADGLAARLVQAGLQGITAKGREFVDKNYIAAFHRHDLKFLVWTINPADRMRHYVALGVDGVITDDPTVFRQNFPVVRPQADGR
ncbi:MAG TPA: glycerophosphodiester phosphodiesterase [Luteolibacter sp.]|nr:glycerophosphodiester phosphodiesterase [Luteolibacter sp.]